MAFPVVAISNDTRNCASKAFDETRPHAENNSRSTDNLRQLTFAAFPVHPTQATTQLHTTVILAARPHDNGPPVNKNYKQREACEEARTLMRSQADRLVADMDLARREEVEILRELTRGLLERIDGLERRISALEGGGSGDPSEA